MADDDVKLDEAQEAASWALGKMKKARAQTKATRAPSADEPFPSVTFTKSGAWIKKQHVRMRRELDEARRSHGEWYDARSRSRNCGPRYGLDLAHSSFCDWARSMEATLAHVQLLAEHAEDDDEFSLTLAEVETLSRTMKR